MLEEKKHFAQNNFFLLNGKVKSLMRLFLFLFCCFFFTYFYETQLEPYSELHGHINSERINIPRPTADYQQPITQYI